jgi:hypothetical protein
MSEPIETPKKKKKSDKIKSEIGLNIPEWGIAIDAAYDPRLTDLVTDHHIVNIVITNRRDQDLVLDPKRDKWVFVDEKGRQHLASNQVEAFDRKLWAEFPVKLKNLLAYPAVVPSRKSTNIDVFVDKTVNLKNFKQVIWKSASLGQEFNIYTSYQPDLNLPPSLQNQIAPQGPTFSAPKPANPPILQNSDSPANGTNLQNDQNQSPRLDTNSKSKVDITLDNVIIMDD